MKKKDTEKKSKLTPKQKKVIDIVATCLQVAIILIAITISAIVIANPISSSAEVSKGKTKLLPVLTGSMDGSAEYYKATGFDSKTGFAEGDLVIAETPKNKLTLKVGQIITFKGSVNGVESLITHRIIQVIDVNNDGEADTYITHGDANLAGAVETVNPLDVLAVYKTHLNGVGKAINWLQNATHFLLVIVLPLALLFIYNIVLMVKMIMDAKVAKARETSAGITADDEEEIKKKAIADYLAKQEEAKARENDDNKTE